MLPRVSFVARSFSQLSKSTKTPALQAPPTKYTTAHVTGSTSTALMRTAAEAVEAARADGVVRSIGLTSHQRPLAARWAESGRLDMLMLRYNAAHRGAEQEVFPLTRRLAMPVVTYTGLRWGALMRSTPADPTHFHPPTAPQWYRFALCQEAITTVLMAPNGRRELEENLTLLEPWQGIDPTQLAAMRDHGDRVRRHAGHFP